jgi:hypothetical protein
LESPEIARLVNWAKEQNMGIGEAVQRRKTRHEHGEQIDMVMDSEEERGAECRAECSGQMCVEDVYSALSEGSEIEPELFEVGGRCGEEHRPDGHAKDYSGPLGVEFNSLCV